jgi:hypothetical protein
MPVDKSRAPLYIALIVFAMLSFVLAITTYLFFQQRTDALKQHEAMSTELAAAQREQRTATSENERLRAVIGMTKDTADTIEAERNQLFEQQFAKYTEGEKSFVKLVEWLNAAVVQLDKDKLDLQQQKESLEDEMKKAVAQAAQDRQRAEQQATTARADQQKQADDYASQRAGTVRQMEEIRVRQQEADARAEQLQAIVAGITELGPFLTNDERDLKVGSKTRSSVDRRARFEKEASDTERLKIVREELQFAEQAIQRLNTTLGRLGVSDPALQRVVREAVNKDDRIDGFDGRVIDVNEADRTALLSVASTAGMRPGLLLSVFDPSDPRPREGDRKAVVEVVQVEGPGVARARIKGGFTRQPILSGDGVATSLWSPGTTVEVVIVGYVDFQGTADDAAQLTRLVERSGARVVEDVTARTRLVVDAGQPRPDVLAAGRAKNWRKPEQDRQKNAVQEARSLGIRVVGLDGLFDMLGLDPAELRGGRLPGVRAAATAAN